MSTQGISDPSILASETVEQYELKEFMSNLDSTQQRLIRFLAEDLSISPSSIAMAMRYSQQDRGPLPMILWRYGFVSLEQLNQIFEWTANQR